MVAAATPAAAAALPWSKLGGDGDGWLLLCDGERKFVPLLLAQGGGVAFGQSGLRRASACGCG
ncbi:MAG: hypothetical protein E6G95_06670 [Alphaproteobacteria bacterium]|nr:MAG: hypothetical protein E6G95_06670 [Alphaproteobacteria bacterium]